MFYLVIVGKLFFINCIQSWLFNKLYSNTSAMLLKAFIKLVKHQIANMIILYTLMEKLVFLSTLQILFK